MPIFQLGMLISLHLAPSLLVSHHQLTHPPPRRSAFPLRKMSVSQGVLLGIKYFLGSLWFGTHLYYSLTAYYFMHSFISCLFLVVTVQNILLCDWSISIARDHRYTKIFYIWSISIAKDRRLRNVARDLRGISQCGISVIPAKYKLKVLQYITKVPGYAPSTVMITRTTTLLCVLHFFVFILFSFTYLFLFIYFYLFI